RILLELSERLFAGKRSASGSSNSSVQLDEIIRQRFASIQPLPIFHTPNSVRTLHLVIDEINQETVSEQTIRAVILSALISNKRNRDLRIITRNRPAHKQTFRKILQLH